MAVTPTGAPAARGHGDSGDTHGCPSSARTRGREPSAATVPPSRVVTPTQGHGDTAGGDMWCQGDKPWRGEHPDLHTQQVCTQVCTHTYMPECTRDACAHVHAHTPEYTRGVCTPACRYGHTHTPNNTHVCANTCTTPAHVWCAQEHICTDMHVCQYPPTVHTHAHTHTRTFTPMHTRAHTCARRYALSPAPTPGKPSLSDNTPEHACARSQPAPGHLSVCPCVCRGGDARRR